MPEIDIAPLTDSPRIRAALSEILIEIVANAGSVSFMHPLAHEAADAFWAGSLAAAARDERIVLGAFDGENLVGTVTLLLDFPPNQPHRAEIAKLMTRISHRGRGIAKALMHAAEREAVGRKRSLLVLDTATEGGASSLYEALGFKLVGEIPEFAFKPHGGLTGTKLYWKRPGAKIAETRTPLPSITHLEKRKIEAGVLIPMVEAFQRAVGKERANEIAREVIVELARKDGERWAGQYGDDLPAMEAVSGVWAAGGSLEIEKIGKSARTLDFNVTRCQYAEYYKGLGLPELGYLFHCNRDFAMAEGFSDAIGLERTQTIMQGASHCDFRFTHKE